MRPGHQHFKVPWVILKRCPGLSTIAPEVRHQNKREYQEGGKHCIRKQEFQQGVVPREMVHGEPRTMTGGGREREEVFLRIKVVKHLTQMKGELRCD